MTADDRSKRIAQLFSDRRLMDDVIRRSHAAVLKRHAAWNAPVVVWHDGRVQHLSTEQVEPNGTAGEMPSMWTL